MVDIPDAKKCCFCIPLRRGLLGVSYFKLACSIAALVIVIFYLMILVYYRVDDIIYLAFFIVMFLTLLPELIFNIIFIVGAHKKNSKYVKIYYYFSIAVLVNYLILLIISFSIIGIHWTVLTEGMEDVLILSLCCGSMLVFIALHIYFIYLVRSEMRKLQLDTLFTFKNHVNEPECSVQIPE